MSELPPWAGAEMIRMADEGHSSKDAEIAELKGAFNYTHSRYEKLKAESERLRKMLLAIIDAENPGQIDDAILFADEALRGESSDE
jgi:hypothetical protein